MDFLNGQLQVFLGPQENGAPDDLESASSGFSTRPSSRSTWPSRRSTTPGSPTPSSALAGGSSPALLLPDGSACGS